MDMTQFVIPKSDQINADDLIAGPRTITITRVSGTSAPDQPVAVYFDGDGGKPYKPCKSMRRVMIAAWGVDAAQYVGREMTLYRDPKVVFGGMEVGGIRISHMSHIDKPIAMALTVTKAKRAPYRVAVLASAPKAASVVQSQDAPTPDLPADAPSASVWSTGATTKTRDHPYGVAPLDGKTRYFASVGAWCQAICEIGDAADAAGDDPVAIWEANLPIYTWMSKHRPDDQGHLDVAATHFRGLHTARQEVERLGV